MEIRYAGQIVSVALCALASSAQAAPEYGSFPVSEGAVVTPALDVEARYDDNIFQTDRNEKDSLVTVLSPAVALEAGSGLDKVSLSYSGEYGAYESSSDDNYDDHGIRAEGHFEGGRGALDGYAGFVMEHDDRGTGPSNGLGGLTTGAFTAPTEYEEALYGVGVTLGNSSRRGRVELGYDGSEIEYQNFETFTRARDRQRDTFRGKVAYDLTGKTDLVLQASTSQVKYDFTPVGQRELDSTENRILAGVEWEATAKTSGEFKLGWQDKDFDDSTRDDQDGGFTWEIGVTWQPRTYSTLGFTTQNSFRETDNEGDVIETTSYSATWDHNWSERLSWNAGLTFNNEDYKGSLSGREDDFFSANFGVSYDFQRWITLATGVKVANRDSSVSRADFDRNQVFVKAFMSL